LNQCLVYVFFKLKEFQNAKILSEQMIAKLDKQVMFSVKEEYEGMFIFKYLLAATLYEIKHMRESLRLFYQLRTEVEKLQNK